MKTYRWFSAVLVLVMVLVGCTPSTPVSQRVINVGMLLARGGLGDRSFNDSAYEGLLEAQRQYGIRFETVDFASDEVSEEAIRRFAEQNYDLLIGVGFENIPFIQAAARDYPDMNLAMIDAVVEGDNVASVIYREPEGDFLMGVLAVMLTESGTVGFIGGADIDVIRRIEAGFKQGVAYQDADVVVLAELAGTFSEPDIGREIALEQYAAGADVIYNAAGRTGLGIIEAAREAGQLTIGTSGDQRYLAPGHVVGNRPKRVDTAVVILVEEVLQDRFAPGVRSLGLQEAGLSIGPFDDNLVTPDMLRTLDDLKARIIAGEIQVVTGD